MEPWCGRTILHFISIVTFVHMEVWVKYFFFIIIFLAIVSFILSELSWYLDKDIIKIRMGDLNNANFYLIPFRAWEILIGSIAVFIVRKHHIVKNSFLELFGILAILYSIFTFNDSSRIPGIEALIPITGTLLVLFYGSSQTFVGKILSLPFFVGMGLISYSLYLWHFPIFSLQKYIVLKSLTLIPFYFFLLSQYSLHICLIDLLKNHFVIKI